MDNPYKIKRIFKASEHNFSVTAFHKKCDEILNTLVLVRTEFGKTIGGFTHYPWGFGSGKFDDFSKKSFLFSLDRKEKYVPQSKNHLIYLNIFGSSAIMIKIISITLFKNQQSPSFSVNILYKLIFY